MPLLGMSGWRDGMKSIERNLTRPFQNVSDPHIQQVVEIQQNGRFHHNGRMQDAGRSHEQGAQTSDDPIPSAQVGRPLASAIPDQQLMPDQHGFGNHAAKSARSCQSNHNAQQMSE
jgi:hypothetical protein